VGTAAADGVIETYHEVAGLSFRVRLRLSHGQPGGWVWLVQAEDHPWRDAGLRGWYTPEQAEAAALRRLERTFGDGGEG